MAFLAQGLPPFLVVPAAHHEEITFASPSLVSSYSTTAVPQFSSVSMDEYFGLWMPQTQKDMLRFSNAPRESDTPGAFRRGPDPEAQLQLWVPRVSSVSGLDRASGKERIRNPRHPCNFKALQVLFPYCPTTLSPFYSFSLFRLDH